MNRNIVHTPMIISFLANIFDATNHWKGVDKDTAQVIFKDLISDTVSSFSLDSLSTGSELLTPQEAKDWERQVPSVARNMASFLCHCNTMGYNGEIDQIIQKLNKDAIGVEVNRHRCYDFLQVFFLALQIGRAHV